MTQYGYQKAYLVAASLGLSLVLFSCCQEKPRTVNNCEASEEQTVYRDKAMPEWAYDRPFYVRPAEGIPAPTNLDDQMVEIYTQKKTLEIPRPCGGDPRKAPRVAVWMTKNRGYKWSRVGYFGLQQSYFPWRVEKDGDYGFRFIGPGIPPAKCKPPKPHIVFHVDTIPPEVAVFVSPEAEAYQPGQTITVEWDAVDENLKPESTSIGVCIGQPEKDACYLDLGKCTRTEQGSIELVIPDQAIDKTITIRVCVQDKAGNYGFGYSCPIPVVYEPPTTRPAASATTKPAKEDDASNSHVLTTMPQNFPEDL